MVIKLQSNFMQKTVNIPLPITINGMLESKPISKSSIKDLIGNWNNSSSETIYKSAVFNVNK